MKKDLIVKFILLIKRIWRNAKKPAVRIRSTTRLSLVADKTKNNNARPFLSFKTTHEIKLLYLIFGLLIALKLLCKLLFD